MANTKSKQKKKPSNKKKNKKKIKIRRKTLIILITSIVVLIAVIISFFALHGSGRRSGNVIQLDKEVAWGIDVSSHNGKIDWEKVKENADFAFIRVGFRGYTEGEISEDKRAKYNMKNANKNNVPIGVYFYSQAINEGEADEEAKFLLEKIKNFDISLPVVIDFEYAYKDGAHTGRLFDAGLSTKDNTKLINAFCNRIRKAGYTPAIYASSYIYKNHLNMKDIDDDVFIWVADYNGDVSYRGFYDIWQYSEKGKCDGVTSKAVDMNYWYIKNRF